MLSKTRRLSLFFFLTAILLSSCTQGNRLARRGLDELDQGNNVTALTLFEKSLEKNKKNSLALYGKGMVLLDSEFTRDIGLSMLSQSLEKLPEKAYRTQAYEKLIEINIRRNHKPQVKELLEQAKQENISSPYLVITASRYEKASVAQNLIEQELVKFPDNILLLRELILTLGVQRKYEEALEKIPKLPSGNEQLFLKVQLTYLKGDQKKAAEVYQKISQHDPAVLQQIERGRWRTRIDWPPEE